MSELSADTISLDDSDEPVETLLERAPAELAGDRDKPGDAARGRELLGLYLRDIAARAPAHARAGAGARAAGAKR